MYSFHHVCLSVTNRERSVAFYKQLGFEPDQQWETPDKGATITHLNNAGMILELFCFHKYEPAPQTSHIPKTDLPVIGAKHFALTVGSIEAARRDLAGKGIMDINTEISQGATGHRYFYIRDPDTILIEIVEH